VVPRHIQHLRLVGQYFFRPLGPREAARELAVDDHDIIDETLLVKLEVIEREVGIDGTDLSQVTEGISTLAPNAEGKTRRARKNLGTYSLTKQAHGGARAGALGALELARIGSLHFIFADSPNDQNGSSSSIDTFATRLSAQPLRGTKRRISDLDRRVHGERSRS
jgi:hypothetical protein